MNPPVCNTAAVIIDPDTGASRVLPSPDPTLPVACPIWSSNAERLACGTLDVAADPSRDGVYTIRSSDGQGLRRVTSNPGGFDEPSDYSPDGKQIVFLRTDPTRPSTAIQALFVVNVDVTGLHQVSPSSESNDIEQGSWSPNGTMILFWSRRHLFVVHPDGTGLAQIHLATPGSRSRSLPPGHRTARGSSSASSPLPPDRKASSRPRPTGPISDRSRTRRPSRMWTPTGGRTRWRRRGNKMESRTGTPSFEQLVALYKLWGELPPSLGIIKTQVRAIDKATRERRPKSWDRALPEDWG